jgi:tetratricopeptide (TPR) repeat protein
MRSWLGGLVLALGMSGTSAARAWLADDATYCRQWVATNPEGAIRACHAAIAQAERAPERLNARSQADLWYQMALAYEIKKDGVSAIAALDRAIAVNADEGKYPYRRARQWQALGNCAKAIPDYLRAAQLLRNPKAGYVTDKNMLYQTYLDRGACHEKLGLFDTARSDYDKALALYPSAEAAKVARRRLGK